MSPLVSYYGGKQRMASKIVPIVESIPHTVYVEPFCGGAAILFAKPVKHTYNGSDYREVLNDTSDLLINLYRVAKLQSEELIKLIDATLYSESAHQKAITICKNPSDYTDLDKAWACYINLYCSFANGLNKGWAFSSYSENKAITFYNKKQQLAKTIKRLDKVYISCQDALDCIDRWDCPDALFYCDPPYPETHQGHYKGYSLDDYSRLCEKLSGIEGKYILSNYPQSIGPTSYTQKLEFKAVMSSAKGVKGQARANNERTEVLWIKRESASDINHLPIFQSQAM
jgi:DNA adenine methylase